MHNALVPILGFAAFSGAGKTTLLTQLIPLLKQSGLRIGLIKHSHHNFEIDKPGKDSYRLRAAGASPVMLVSKFRRAIVTDLEKPEEPKLQNQLPLLDQSKLDIILVEGFKNTQFPKIEIHRPDLNKPLLFPNDPSIIAIASDCRIAISDKRVFLDLNNPRQIADFILYHFLQRTHD